MHPKVHQYYTIFFTHTALLIHHRWHKLNGDGTKALNNLHLIVLWMFLRLPLPFLCSLPWRWCTYREYSDHAVSSMMLASEQFSIKNVVSYGTEKDEIGMHINHTFVNRSNPEQTIDCTRARLTAAMRGHKLSHVCCRVRSSSWEQWAPRIAPKLHLPDYTPWACYHHT
jgi:hypothetical protein